MITLDSKCDKIFLRVYRTQLAVGDEKHGPDTPPHPGQQRGSLRAAKHGVFVQHVKVSPRVAWASSMTARQVSLTLELFQSFGELRGGDQVK